MDLPAPPMGAIEESGTYLKCNNCDTEVVHRIANLLLRGVATASVDSTAGDLFKNPSSVAADVKPELVNYLIQKTKLFVSDFVLSGEDKSDQLIKASTSPVELLSELVDEFVSPKKNLFSHVSGLLSSENRGNKINDFVHKLEMSTFWPLDSREAIAVSLLQNIDMRCSFHCPERFDTTEKLDEHRSQCKFRPVDCTNEGCEARYSANHLEKHDSICPFKVLPCEQHCQQTIMRSDMARHCSTVCLMKLINCPFYELGCETAFPQCSLEKHGSDFFQSHLLYVLHAIQRHGSSMGDLNRRVQLLEKTQSLNELSGALDMRSLTLITKEQEAKIKKLERDLKAQEAKMKKLEQELRASRA